MFIEYTCLVINAKLCPCEQFNDEITQHGIALQALSRQKLYFQRSPLSGAKTQNIATPETPVELSVSELFVKVEVIDITQGKILIGINAFNDTNMHNATTLHKSWNLHVLT